MTDTEPNEILEAARAAKARKAGAEETEAALRSRRWQIGSIGLGVGIGSAAVSAAILFANRERQKREE